MPKPAHPHPDRNGVLGLASQLGECLDRAQPIPVVEQIAGPTRPSRGRWSKEAWAEMQAIYAAGDAFAREQGL